MIYFSASEVDTTSFLLWSFITCGNIYAALDTDEKTTRRDLTRKMMIFIPALKAQGSPGTAKSQPISAESWMYVGLRMGSAQEMGLGKGMPSWTLCLKVTEKS